MAGFIELEDAKLHLRLDGTDEDGELERLIEASAAFIAANYGVVPAQDLHLQLDGFRPNIRIPCRPVDIETIVVTYVDPVGDEKQFDDYRTFTRDGWTWLQPKVGKAWPSFAPVEGAVTISATCGYSESDAPADLCTPPGCWSTTGIIIETASIFLRQLPICSIIIAFGGCDVAKEWPPK